jgi:hypothetical protein
LPARALSHKARRKYLRTCRSIVSKVSGSITSAEELESHRKVGQGNVLVVPRFIISPLKTQNDHISRPKIIMLFAVHCLLDTLILATSSQCVVVFVKDLHRVVQLIQIFDSPYSRGQNAVHIRPHVWFSIWMLAPTPASTRTLEAAHPNKSRLLFMLGEEDGEFVGVVRTRPHEVEVLFAK